MFYSSPTANRVERGLLTSNALSDADPLRYPRSHQEWIEWYQYRIDACHGETYSNEFIKGLQLFRALDDNGKVISVTRRLFRDVAFVVEVATAAIAIDQVTISATPDADPRDVEIARAIWKRSQPERFGGKWIRVLCSTGDYGIEPVRFRTSAGPGSIGFGTRLIGHDPRTMFLQYDDMTETQLERVIITHQTIGESTVDTYGNVAELGALTVHQRTITDTTITNTTQDNGRAPDSQESGEHRLGVVPFVHLPCIPYTESAHSQWIAPALDRPLAEIDSLFSQISAVGDRFANPRLSVIGAKIGDESKLSRFGRILNIHSAPPDVLNAVRVSYLEANLNGLSVLADRIDRLLEQVRGTLPEYLFSGSAAGLSGEALRLLSTRYVQKYRSLRRRVYGGLERALAIGVAIERGRPFDPDRFPVVLSGPDLLPADVPALVDTVAKARQAGMISAVDAVRHAQRVDLASSEVDPAEYLEEMIASTQIQGEE